MRGATRCRRRARSGRADRAGAGGGGGGRGCWRCVPLARGRPAARRGPQRGRRGGAGGRRRGRGRGAGGRRRERRRADRLACPGPRRVGRGRPSATPAPRRRRGASADSLGERAPERERGCPTLALMPPDEPGAPSPGPTRHREHGHVPGGGRAGRCPQAARGRAGRPAADRPDARRDRPPTVRRDGGAGRHVRRATRARPVAAAAPVPRRPRPRRTRRRRRHPKVRARKVHRIVRHIEPWSVLKVSVLFFLSIFLIICVASAVLWNAGSQRGRHRRRRELRHLARLRELRGHRRRGRRRRRRPPQTTIAAASPQLGAGSSTTVPVAEDPEDERSTIPDEDGEVRRGPAPGRRLQVRGRAHLPVVRARAGSCWCCRARRSAWCWPCCSTSSATSPAACASPSSRRSPRRVRTGSPANPAATNFAHPATARGYSSVG